MEERHKVEHPRESYYLNKDLLDRQGVWDNLSVLIDLHKKKLDTFDYMEKLDPMKDRMKLRVLSDRVRSIEYALQENWGFKKDSRYHEWYKVPHCECPKIDNYDARGTGHNYINLQCPIHGVKI